MRLFLRAAPGDAEASADGPGHRAFLGSRKYLPTRICAGASRPLTLLVDMWY